MYFSVPSSVDVLFFSKITFFYPHSITSVKESEREKLNIFINFCGLPWAVPARAHQWALLTAAKALNQGPDNQNKMNYLLYALLCQLTSK